MSIYAKFNRLDRIVPVYDVGYASNPVRWMGSEAYDSQGFTIRGSGYLLSQSSNPSREITIKAEPKLGGGGFLSASAIGVRHPEFRLLSSISGAGNNSNNFPTFVFRGVKIQYIVPNPSPQGILQQIQFTFEDVKYENV